MSSDKKVKNKTLGAKKLPLPNRPMLIEHRVDGSVILQRPVDGYINATAMCEKAGESFTDYFKLPNTKAFLSALKTNRKIPTTKLIQIITNGIDPELHEVWVHPHVAINLAQWLSPEFAVQVSSWVFDWMEGKSSGYMPLHVKRYMANRAKVPPTHFSMLNEMYLNLIAPLEECGFILPDKMIPDLSTGKMFSNFLRRRGINVNEFERYLHQFLDNKRPEVWVRLYPIEHLLEFREYLYGTWFPNHAEKYFEERAPEALPYLKEIIAALPAPVQKKKKPALSE